MNLKSPAVRPGYWLMQILIWSAYAGLNTVLAALFGQFRKTTIVFAFILSASLLGASHALRRTMHSRGWLERGVLAASWRLLGASALLAFVIQAVGVAVIVAFSPAASNLSARVFLIYWINTTIILMLWAAGYAGYKTFERWRAGEIDRWRTQALLHEAELNLLKAQLDPHFVFNALNNIRAVILEDPQRARSMLTHLSQSLRHVLQHSQRNLVSLREELAAVEDYLALIDLHTDGALTVERSIDPSALETQIPPLAVQLLVENAIKHGAQQRSRTLQLRVARAGDRVIIEVVNPGALAATAPGVGLTNLRERLARSLGARVLLDLSDRGGAVCARLDVPQ